ncbi:hypothetical protein MLD38_015389 [Melastoma candidum]|uniref:Uncharacterized protein n=1 Tax=Melastoma candidum TaxID=119954 RepID=A0ACB9RFY3_9MYRT|nr:hypothetical protein MLD38_015389 [Melastoma candidum]
MDAGGGRVVSSGSGAVPSLEPPCPRSPPEYPDLYGKRRESTRVQMLEREIGFLQEELKLVEGLEPASRCCKEVVEFSLTNSDTFIPTYPKRGRSCGGFWEWLWSGISWLNFSWVCCCCYAFCPPDLNLPCRCTCESCIKCPECRRTCESCIKCPECRCPSCSFPKSAVGFPGLLVPAGAALGTTVPAATALGTVAAAAAAISGAAAFRNAPAIVDVENVGVRSCRGILVLVSAVEAYAVLIPVTIVIEFDMCLGTDNSKNNQNANT